MKRRVTAKQRFKDGPNTACEHVRAQDMYEVSFIPPLLLQGVGLRQRIEASTEKKKKIE